jgi:nucleoside-diphosphate-sugar epimerase
MKVLVTGTTGFIGKHLVARLEKEGHTVTALTRAHDVDHNVPNLIALMEREKFDGVIHLASLFLGQHKPEDIKGLIDSNVFLGTAVLEAATKAKVPWFINTGTFWQHYQSKSYSPVNLYAATKQAFETIAQYYRETSDIIFVTLKLNDTFGPGDTRAKIFALWQKISASGESMDMSPGKQLIDISYIDNVVDAYMQLITLLSKKDARKLNGKAFAVIAPKRMPLKKLAELYEKTTSKKLTINWGKKDYRPREVMVPWTKGVKVPGWKARISLEQGIKKLYE